ncbi:MAG: DUF3040 domain-containing protein [Cellulomonadaceae bacterium]|jgi:hypothetical protein|nr:DUF3040 domain-containing protein [Cellulomonadaceae bacterium]
MPLSEYEQRMLDQMERALTNDDPRLANALQSAKPRRSVTRYAIGIGGGVVGLLVLILGAVAENVYAGIVGFVVMFAAVAWGFLTSSRLPAGRRTIDGTTADLAVDAKNTASKPKSAFMDRLEERWDRRNHQQG